jgi:hypothetical protein
LDTEFEKMRKIWGLVAVCAVVHGWTTSIHPPPGVRGCSVQQHKFFAAGSNGLDEEMTDHPLVDLGILMSHIIDTSVGETFAQAGQAWAAKDWGGTTKALGEASKALQACADGDGNISAQAWQMIATELEDISNIEGCSSVGPPASIPNWIAIQELLVESNENQAAALIDRLVGSI